MKIHGKPLEILCFSGAAPKARPEVIQVLGAWPAHVPAITTLVPRFHFRPLRLDVGRLFLSFLEGFSTCFLSFLGVFERFCLVFAGLSVSESVFLGSARPWRAVRRPW